MIHLTTITRIMPMAGLLIKRSWILLMSGG
jgi:hypothetical protein